MTRPPSRHDGLTASARLAVASLLAVIGILPTMNAARSQPPAEPGLRQVEPATFTPAGPTAVRTGPSLRRDPAPADEPAAVAGEHAAAAGAAPGSTPVSAVVERLRAAGSIDTALSAAVALGVASLVPAILLMTTCFVRMSIVLALVRQGLGTPQLPSNQILSALALFLSALVMWPVWTAAYREGVEPFEQGRIGLAAACDRGSLPVRRWMAGQIEQAGNRDTMRFFLERHPAAPLEVATYDDVPVEALLPAFLVSELETAFAIGFRLLLPFLVLDVLVATLVMSTGLVMLPPTLVSLPLKLLVFVAADGWTLVVGALLDGMRHAAT